jgi:LDH2 family malate/lactate/ureidoglycolate dehydrogenase
MDHRQGRRATTNPKDFYDGGALLTVGAHKGSGLRW